jgi:hypothetical protein
MKTIAMIMLAASRTAAAAFAPRTSLAFATTARSYSRSVSPLMAGNPKGAVVCLRIPPSLEPFPWWGSFLTFLVSSFHPVFFDMEVGGEPAGRIEFELRADGMDDSEGRRCRSHHPVSFTANSCLRNRVVLYQLSPRLPRTSELFGA